MTREANDAAMQVERGTAGGGHPTSPPLGFRGLDPNKRVRIYTRHLPHWRQEGATYFVTFRLADALPEAKIIEIKNHRAWWEHTHPEPRSEKDWEEYAHEVTRRTEAWLDQGHGVCHFREPRWANDLCDRLLHFQNERYHLACWVIMPNHCHLVIRPFDGHDLEDLIGGMKSVTARHITAEVHQPGDLWQQESYDRIVRDLDHLHRVIQYIGRNPAQAELPRSAWFRWIDPTWQAAGWGFES